MAAYDCDMTFQEYWDKYSFPDLAVARGWELLKAPGNVMYCPTLDEYSKWVEKVSPYLEKPISEITFYDLLRAIDKIRYTKRGGGKYAVSSLGKVASIFWDVFRFASDRGHAANIMAFTRAGSRKKDQGDEVSIEGILEGLTDPTASEAEFFGRVRASMEGRPYHKRSLLPKQQAKLIRILSEKINSDGRYFALAILLYAGLRPAECRALCWKDIVPFFDHPDRHFLCLYRSRDSKGKIKNKMKTANAYRKIPVHIELEALLKRRLEFVKTACAGTDDYLEWPVCCFGNDLKTPCRDYQLAALADEVLEKLCLTAEDLAAYMADMLWDSTFDEEKDSTTHLSLYVLRRNFWTWMQSLTQLTEMEKKCVMGHRMIINEKNLRPGYNNQEVLWEICKKMDKCTISLRMHNPLITHKVTKGDAESYENCGVLSIEVPPELQGKEGKVKIRATSECCGERIMLELLSGIRQLGKLKVTSALTHCPEGSHKVYGVNSEMDHYEMLMGLSERIKKSKSNKNN